MTKPLKTVTKSYHVKRGNTYYSFTKGFVLWSSHKTDATVFRNGEDAIECAGRHYNATVVEKHDVVFKRKTQKDDDMFKKKPVVKKIETEKTTVQKPKSRNPRTKWTEGEVTKAGCKIIKVVGAVEDNPHGSTILTVECMETKRHFDIMPQDAHQVKYHPEVRELYKRRDRALMKKKDSSVSTPTKSGKAAKTKPKRTAVTKKTAVPPDSTLRASRKKRTAKK